MVVPHGGQAASNWFNFLAVAPGRISWKHCTYCKKEERHPVDKKDEPLTIPIVAPDPGEVILGDTRTLVGAASTC